MPARPVSANRPWLRPALLAATGCGAVALALLRWQPRLVALVTPGGGRCPLRALVHVPCPTCGGTRAALALAHADVTTAWRANPSLTALVLGASVAAAWALLTPRWARWRGAPAVRPRALVGIGLGLALVGWMFQIAAYR